MSLVDYVTIGLIIAGCFFFSTGTVGLLRFPDIYTRLHALTKADNTGLGFIVFAAVLQVGAVSPAIKLILIWLLVIMTSATIAHLIARSALLQNQPFWEKDKDNDRFV